MAYQGQGGALVGGVLGASGGVPYEKILTQALNQVDALALFGAHGFGGRGRLLEGGLQFINGTLIPGGKDGSSVAFGGG